MSPDEIRASEDEHVLATAGDSLGGVTSKGVYQTMGRPPSGMSSKEPHHDGRHGRKKCGPPSAKRHVSVIYTVKYNEEEFREK
jgi:hypothetical protein